MTYGIGRLARDTDQATETLAAIEAEALRRVKGPSGFAPAGTTEGVRTPGARCATCGKPANWNPGAGQSLCRRHWDEY